MERYQRSKFQPRIVIDPYNYPITNLQVTNDSVFLKKMSPNLLHIEEIKKYIISTHKQQYYSAYLISVCIETKTEPDSIVRLLLAICQCSAKPNLSKSYKINITSSIISFFFSDPNI